MKKIYLFLSFLIVILAYPLISLLTVLIIGNLVQNTTPWIRPMTLFSLATFILIFRKNIRCHSSFNRSLSLKTIISVCILTISMCIAIGMITPIPQNISLAKQELLNFPRSIYSLFLIPILEELCFRIIIINKFKGKMNQWIIITGTALLFGIIHTSSIYTMISMACFGFILGYLYIKSENGFLLILIHSLYSIIVYCSYSVFWPITSRVLNYVYSPIYYIIVAISIMYIIYFFTQKKYI